MELSALSRVIAPTLSRQLFMMAKRYDDVVDFTLGDPDIRTPEGICHAAYLASIEGHTRYAPNAGIPELREAIAHFESTGNGADYEPSNVAVTVGATEAIYLALLSVLNPGDEVIILAPYWVQYENIVRLIGAKPVIINCMDSFEPDLLSLRKAVNGKTRVVIVNSPNNPSGHIYSEKTLREIASIAVDNHLLIVADEVYRSLSFDHPCPSLGSFCPHDNLIVINSFSKQFAMTGWRVGYVVASEEITASIVKFQQNIAVCVSTPNQYAALEALSNADHYASGIRDCFRHRRDVLKAQLDNIDGIRFQVPGGTFYAFIDISSTGLDSKSFCFSLLETEHVAVIPGIAFGNAFDRFIRLAFTLDEDRIIEGISRINRFIHCK